MDARRLLAFEGGRVNEGIPCFFSGYEEAALCLWDLGLVTVRTRGLLVFSHDCIDVGHSMGYGWGVLFDFGKASVESGHFHALNFGIFVRAWCLHCSFLNVVVHVRNFILLPFLAVDMRFEERVVGVLDLFLSI